MKQDDPAGKTPPPSLRGHQRFAARLRSGHGKTRLPPIADAEPVWTGRMSVIAVTAALLAFALTFYDGRINAAVLASESPLRGFMADWTDLVRSQWYLVPSAIIILVAGFADWGEPDSGTRRVWSNLYSQALFVFASVAGALMTTNVLKFIFGRARPLLADDLSAIHFEPFTLDWEFASFPSGHSTTAATLTVILMAWMPRFRWFFLAAGLFMAATRVAAHAHYPSDIVAGFAIGFLFTLSLARWLARRRIAFVTEPGHLVPIPLFRAASRQLLEK